MEIGLPVKVAQWQKLMFKKLSLITRIAVGKLFVDGSNVAKVDVKRTMGFRISLDETFDIGIDAGEPVSEEYHVPFDFTGEIGKVVVKLGSGAK